MWNVYGVYLIANKKYIEAENPKFVASLKCKLLIKTFIFEKMTSCTSRDISFVNSFRNKYDINLALLEIQLRRCFVIYWIV